MTMNLQKKKKKYFNSQVLCMSTGTSLYVKDDLLYYLRMDRMLKLQLKN